MCLQMASLPELAYKQEPLLHIVILNSLFLKAFFPYQLSHMKATDLAYLFRIQGFN